jgi:hypothetical protein
MLKKVALRAAVVVRRQVPGQYRRSMGASCRYERKIVLRFEMVGTRFVTQLSHTERHLSVAQAFSEFVPSALRRARKTSRVTT